jgi:signal transduction histidine kinase
LQGVLTDITERKAVEAQLEEAATAAERQRLARELHDSVTQTLFSASVIAEATPRIWQKNLPLAERNLNQIAHMLHGALAEMRTMLLELRPDAIQGKKMTELLQVLIEANQPRINAPISLTVDGDDALPAQVMIALHRVAQEALNNVSKHAEAGAVEVKLICDQSHVRLSIRDNGRGFDPRTIPAGHFGLRTMGERLERIGGRLSIDSQPGKGTEISASWSEQEGKVSSWMKPT